MGDSSRFYLTLVAGAVALAALVLLLRWLVLTWFADHRRGEDGEEPDADPDGAEGDPGHTSAPAQRGSDDSGAGDGGSSGE